MEQSTNPSPLAPLPPVDSDQVELQVSSVLSQVSDSEDNAEKISPLPAAAAPVSRPAAAVSSRSRRGSFFPGSTIFSIPVSNSSSPSGSNSNFNVNVAPLKILVASWNVGNAMPPKNPKLIHEWIPEGGGDFDVIVIGLQESSYREKTSGSSGSGNATVPMNGEETLAAAGADASESRSGSPRKEEAAAPKETTEWDSETDECYENGAAGSPTRGGRGRDDDIDDDENENEIADDDQDDQELGAALTETRQVARKSSRSSSPHLRKLSVTPTRTGGEDGDRGDEASESPTATASKGSLDTGEVVIKRSRTKKSMRKVSKLVRQVSTNLRDSVADVLDYAFNKQIYLHLGEDYALIGKVELMEMRLFVYVHTRHAVSGIEKISVPTGLGSVLGNKGGLVFKFVVQDTSLCFVSCHLAAHQDQKFLDKRNSDCASILGAHFGMKKVSLDHQFDHCFWFGDLNYRVDLNYTKQRERTTEQHFAEVLAHVRAKKWAFLNNNDQLKFQIEEKKALTGWELPPALFPPTFKRIRHAPDEYNPQRIPSYCDRVLHKSLPGRRANLKLQRFTCIEAISSSDHKPVLAEFHVQPSPPIAVDTSLIGANATLIEITELAAKDLLGMDMTGLSDPYVKFYSVPSGALQLEGSGSHPSTTTIMSTLSPAWRDEQIPKLYVHCDQEKDVRLVHLLLALMDYDTTSTDDVLGAATLSLDKFCFPKPRYVPFEAPVVCHGKTAGTVSGKLRVTMPHQAGGLANDSSSSQGGQMTTCYCNVC